MKIRKKNGGLRSDRMKYNAICSAQSITVDTVLISVCRLIAVPIGRWYKIKETPPRKVEHNEVLEKAFKEYRKLLPSHTVVMVCF